MKYTQNTSGFSMIFAMGIVLTISLTVIYLLEYILPYAADTKGIEFSSNAFYQSSSAIEDALFFVANNPLGDENDDPLDINNNGLAGVTRNTDLAYTMTASGNTIPPIWEWNSEFDPNWNRLSSWEPLQLEVWWDKWNSARIRVKVPDTSWLWGTTELRSMTWWIVAWQLSSIDDTLNSSGATNRIGHDMLKINNVREFDINNTSGNTLQGTSSTFASFYSSYCGTGQECTLKLSVINDLILDNSNRTPTPYIEYQITWANNIPLRYTRIRSSGFSAGFKKDIDVKIPQQTVSEAFDFTVFQ